MTLFYCGRCRSWKAYATVFFWFFWKKIITMLRKRPHTARGGWVVLKEESAWPSQFLCSVMMLYGFSNEILLLSMQIVECVYDSALLILLEKKVFMPPKLVVVKGKGTSFGLYSFSFCSSSSASSFSSTSSSSPLLLLVSHSPSCFFSFSFSFP